MFRLNGSKNPENAVKRPWTQARALRFYFPILLCLVMIVEISGISAVSADTAQAKSAATTGEAYLLDKVITWADGSTEHVQISKDGFFQLDGEKRKLVGMVLSMHLPYGETNQFYLPENLAILDKELTYLESIGIRLVRVELTYVRWWKSGVADERAAWGALLDLCYQHKMLVIPHFIAKWFTVFDDLSNPNFTWSIPIGGKWVDNADSVSEWATRFAETVNAYQNVVAVGAENELDQKLTKWDFTWDPNARDQSYTAAGVNRYMSLLTGILRARVNVPIVHNLVPNSTETEIKQVIMDYVDVPAFDCYGKTSSEIVSDLKYFLPRMGVSSGWWCLELNYGGIENAGAGSSQWVVNAGKFSDKYINTVFDQGATVAILYSSSDKLDERQGFFGNDGMPKPQLIQVAKSINTFQVAVDKSPTLLAKR